MSNSYTTKVNLYREAIIAAIEYSHAAIESSDAEDFRSSRQIFKEGLQGIKSLILKNGTDSKNVNTELIKLVPELTCVSDSDIPHWLQRNAFEFYFNGYDLTILYDGLGNAPHFQFLAKNRDQKFISETGYKSLYVPGEVRNDLRSFLCEYLCEEYKKKLIIPDKVYEFTEAQRQNFILNGSI